MKRTVRKKRKRKIKKVIIFLAVVYIFSIFIRQHFTMKALQEQKQTKVNQIKNLENDVVTIDKEIKYINILDEIKSSNNNIENKKDIPEEVLKYIENLARNELHMVKPGDILFLNKGNNKNNY